jgi:uncharacterized RDD family membrane protein YckC
MAYDWLLLAGVLFVATLALIVIRGGEAIAPRTGWYEVMLLAISFGFYGWFWTHGGQTLGLRAWRLRVVTLNGGALSWGDAARRFIASATLLLPPGLGLIWCVVDRDRRGWHDRLSRTRIERTDAKNLADAG